jgi:hypothetical protein
MYYGIDDQFNAYMMSTKNSPKVEQIRMKPNVSFLVFMVEDPYDQSWEVEINGAGVFVEDREEIVQALEMMKGRNPFADVALESGITRQFDFIKLVPDKVRFRIYGDALQGIEPTIIDL